MIGTSLGYLVNVGAADIQSQVAGVGCRQTPQRGIITDPHTISGEQRLHEAIRKMERTHIGTLPVVDAQGRLIGLLTERDVRFASSDALVTDRMTPRHVLVAHAGPISLNEAERVMRERKVKKLPRVNSDDVLWGIITAKDLRTAVA